MRLLCIFLLALTINTTSDAAWSVWYPGEPGGNSGFQSDDGLGSLLVFTDTANYYTGGTGSPSGQLTGQAAIDAAYAADPVGFTSTFGTYLIYYSLTDPTPSGGNPSTGEVDTASQTLLDTISTSQSFGVVVLIVLALVSICLAVAAAAKKTLRKGVN